MPRKIGTSGAVWLVLAVVAAANLAALGFEQPVPAARFETSILVALAGLRTPWLSDLMGGINTFGSYWGHTVLAWGLILAVIAFRRWRHLFVFLGAYAVLVVVGRALYDKVARPRPYGVWMIGDWGGFSMPSPPVAVLAAVLMGIVYSLVPHGRARNWAKRAGAGVLALFGFARLYLGIDHPSDVVYAVILGVALPLVAFRWFTPNEAFPVSYRKGKKAHLDVTGARGRAIVRAIERQLGLTVLEVKPVGLEGSAGSTPLCLTVAGDPETYLFAKLYSKSHVRADRWYKLGRTILYEALEDEAPFQTVRRLVEYEDYTLRVLRDSGIPTATPYGVVEITPEREYMLITGFIDDARKIGDAEVDDRVIDEGLLLVRRLWDAGLAHRDIKPANVLVRDRRVYLIDPFFVQVRPSPWRQAVDLANMMLVLAVRSEPERVYARALQYFTPDEIAEAFAATRGVASPTQLRVAVKQDGRDLLTRFRALAPERRPIVIQRWNVRRVVLALTVAAVALFAAAQARSLLLPLQDPLVSKAPECGTGSSVILMAQAVPSASAVPCIDSLPAGWSFARANIHNGSARFSLDSDRAGSKAVSVTLAADCDVSRARQVPVSEGSVASFVESRNRGPRFSYLEYERIPGACVTYDVDFDDGAPASLLADIEEALAVVPRSTLVRTVDRELDLKLCGLGVRCPGRP
ncbi:MAG: phosphatase PAP2 family protein [Actinomycetota bacterium]|nr:phosphatase PAP2 family protein [Actinomycetota bacterium]